MKNILFLILFLPLLVKAQDGVKPIIDVHLHGYTERTYRALPGAPASYEEFKSEVEHYFVKYNIVAAMKSGGVFDGNLQEKMLNGYESNNYPKFDTVEFKRMIKEGEIQVWGEFMPMFNGLTIADPEFAPYLAICEREGIPIALHTGSGPPGISRRYKNYRYTLGSPLVSEEVFINYPNLKVYLMHSGGGVYYDEAIAMMMMYPQVYCGLGALLWIDIGPTADNLEDFLRTVKNSNMTDRVMFGSDAGYWPHQIEESIRKLDSFEILDEEDKRKIFYENAVRFFELDHLSQE